MLKIFIFLLFLECERLLSQGLFQRRGEFRNQGLTPYDPAMSGNCLVPPSLRFGENKAMETDALRATAHRRISC